MKNKLLLSTALLVASVAFASAQNAPSATGGSQRPDVKVTQDHRQPAQERTGVDTGTYLRRYDCACGWNLERSG